LPLLIYYFLIGIKFFADKFPYSNRIAIGLAVLLSLPLFARNFQDW